MNTNFPTRPLAHRLEEISYRYFVRHLPENWTSEKLLVDYGVDLRVDIFEGEAATGLELLVQLKASEDAIDGDTEHVVLNTRTFNMLDRKLQVVMLVKYSHAEDEAYWLFLKDARRPQDDAETVTIRIPKTNRFSNIAWNDIQGHVRNVTDVKLAAMRRMQIEASKGRA